MSDTRRCPTPTFMIKLNFITFFKLLMVTTCQYPCCVRCMCSFVLHCYKNNKSKQVAKMGNKNHYNGEEAGKAPNNRENEKIQ